MEPMELLLAWVSIRFSFITPLSIPFNVLIHPSSSSWDGSSGDRSSPGDAAGKHAAARSTCGIPS
jgi:hypothetical protein